MNGSVLGNVDTYQPINYNFKLVCQSFCEVNNEVCNSHYVFFPTGFKIGAYKRKKAVVEDRTREYNPIAFPRRQKL